MQVVSLTARAETGWLEYRARLSAATALQAALLLLVVGNVGRIPLLELGERQAPLLLNDLCIASVLAVGGLALLRARTLQLSDVAIAAAIFVGIGAISAVAAVPRFGLTAFELLGSLAYLARWCLYFALYLIVINCVRAGKAEAVWLAMERALLAIAAFGIVQAIFLPDFAFTVYPDARELLDWDPQRHRLVSTILEPNVAAGMILIVLLVQLARLGAGVRVPAWKPVLLLAALVMTLSRSGVVALLVGCCVLLAVHGLSKRLMRLAGVLLVIMLVSLPKLISFAADYARLGLRDESALARVGTWQRAIATFLENPWFGIGFNTYGFVQERRGFERLGTAAYSAEGGLLFIAVMTGIVGLVVYMGMLWFVMRRCRRAWRDQRASAAERGLLIGTTAATAAILVHSIFVNSLLMPFVMELLWVLWGLSFIVAANLSRRTLEPQSP